MFDEKNRLEWRYENMLATLVLVGALTIGFLSVQFFNRHDSEMAERLNALGAAYAMSIWQGEVWRFFTAIFLHSSVLLYLINTIALFQLGKLLERLYGAPRFFLFFVLCGAFGFAVNILTGNGFYFGSSMSIFGLIGGLVGAHLNQKWKESKSKLLTTLVLYLTAHLLFSFSNSTFSHFIAECIVFISSFGLGTVIGFAFLAENSKWSKSATWCLLAGLTVFFIVMVNAVKPEFSARYHQIMALESLRMKDYPASRNHSDWLRRKKETETLGQMLAARISANLGENERALSFARVAFAQHKDVSSFWKDATFDYDVGFPNFVGLFFDEKGSAVFCKLMTDENINDVQVMNDCAWLYLVALDKDLRDPKLGLALAMRAAKTMQEAPTDLLNTLAEAYLQNGQLKEALQVIDRAIINGNLRDQKFLLPQKMRIELELAQSNQR